MCVYVSVPRGYALVRVVDWFWIVEETIGFIWRMGVRVQSELEVAQGSRNVRYEIWYGTRMFIILRAICQCLGDRGNGGNKCGRCIYRAIIFLSFFFSTLVKVQDCRVAVVDTRMHV